MQPLIVERLEGIEQAQNVSILYAAESGSRAWGFASEDSDWDVRFLYARPVREYVRLNPPRDVIELPIENDLDINGWDIVKALTLFRKSNPPLLEWLQSPLVYRENVPFAGELRELAREYASLRNMAYHYVNMARTNWRTAIAGRETVVLKKYLYVMRPLACVGWIETHHTPAPTALQDVLQGIGLPDAVREELHTLIARKQAGGETGADVPNTVLDGWIEAERTRLETVVPTLPDVQMPVEPLNALLWRTLGM